MSLFGPSLQAKAQQRRRLPSPAWCTAQVTATAQQRLGHRHSAGSQARPPRSPFRPLRARPPPTTRTELAIAIQTAPPVKGNGDPTRIPGARPGPTGDGGGRSVSARGPAARASSPAPEGRARSRPAGSDPERRRRPLGRGPRRRQAPARPRAARRRRQRLTCGLSSSVSSMGSLSIPGIVAKAGRRQDTRRPPTARRAAPPAAADPTRPLAGAAAPAGSSEASAREIPPPRPVNPAFRTPIGSPRRPSTLRG